MAKVEVAARSAPAGRNPGATLYLPKLLGGLRE